MGGSGSPHLSQRIGSFRQPPDAKEMIEEKSDQDWLARKSLRALISKRRLWKDGVGRNGERVNTCSFSYPPIMDWRILNAALRPLAAASTRLIPFIWNSAFTRSVEETGVGSSKVGKEPESI